MEKQNKKNRSEIVFWFNTPPKVSKGAFNYVTKVWGNKVIYVINKDFPEYRKKTNWNDGDFGDAEVIMLSECENEYDKIKEIFNNYPQAIHVVSAFTNSIQQKIRRNILCKDIKLVVFSERPVTVGNWFEKNIRKVYFKYKYRKLKCLFEPYVSVFMPFGMLGVNTFASYGWDKEKLFPFMYNPVICKKNDLHSSNAQKDVVKFLYVGRFYYKTKGIDTLMKATEFLKGDWQLDLVGGYGKNKMDVLEWEQRMPNVTYLGSWQSQDVCTNMMQYDIVVVPSKYDGWNLLPNEALHAGIGTIVTNEAVSDELISTSGAGEVVPARDYKTMAQVMQMAIDNHQLVQEWKKNANSYVHRISSITVGEYFMNILDYVFYKKGDRPQCPWL